VKFSRKETTLGADAPMRGAMAKRGKCIFECYLSNLQAGRCKIVFDPDNCPSTSLLH
jgi:hypothetical protein